ncbi:MAG: F0F1 ATP synthase subunit delta [Patescibacteria group bacterium]
MKKTPKSIAQSLIRSLEIKEAGELSALISELGAFHTGVQRTTIFKALKGILTRNEEKNAILDKMLSSIPLSNGSQALLFILVQKNQVADLPRVIAALKELRVKTFNVDEADVITVRALSISQRETAEKLLQKISGCTVIIKERINPAILGGLVVRLRDSIIDASLIRKIRDLKKRLAV